MPEVPEIEFSFFVYLHFFVCPFNLYTRITANLTFKLESQIYLAAEIQVDNHERNFCSVAFLRINTLYDCIHRRKSYNHLAQHNKQHHTKVVLLSGVHVNGDPLSHYASLSDFKGKNIFGTVTFKPLIFPHMCFCSKETPENKRTTCYDIEVEVVSNC